jgi:hypothetical protein
MWSLVIRGACGRGFTAQGLHSGSALPTSQRTSDSQYCAAAGQDPTPSNGPAALQLPKQRGLHVFESLQEGSEGGEDLEAVRPVQGLVRGNP